MEQLRIRYIIWGCIFSFIPLLLVAQDTRPTSYLGLGIEGGASNLIVGTPTAYPDLHATPLLGGGGGAALLYTFEYKHFMVQTGFGASYTINSNKFLIPDYTADILEYPSMHYHYTFDKYLEKHTYGVGYIPLKLGMTFGKWYFLAGAKIGVFSFAETSKALTDVSIWATDDEILDPLQGLHTHAMGNYHFEGDVNTVSFNPFNAMLSAEIGVSLNKRAWLNEKEKKKYDRAQRYRNLRKKKTLKELMHYRLAIFADYGLSNLHAYQPNPLPFAGETTGGLVDLQGISDLKPHSTLGYMPYKDSPLNNLVVGLKLSVQYEIPKKAPKKGSMASPYIYVYAKDEVTGKAISNARVKIQRKGDKYVYDKLTDTKLGRVGKATPAGKYTIHIAHGNYCAIDTIQFEHRDDYDTVYVALHPLQPMCWSVVNALTNQPVAASLELRSLDGKMLLSQTTDSTNRVCTKLDNRLSYVIVATSEGYETFVDTILCMDSMQISMMPIPKKTFVLKNMHFATAQTTILPSSKESLNMLYELLHENPEVYIRIVGHTDDIGNEESNRILSEGRAQSIYDEMIQRGIDPKRIQTCGKGESQPIVPNTSDTNRQMNRRVEIEIISGDEDVKIERLMQ